MIIDLPNESAIESSIILFVKWLPQEGEYGARVVIDRRFGVEHSREFIACVSNEEAQKLSARVIKQWKEPDAERADSKLSTHIRATLRTPKSNRSTS